MNREGLVSFYGPFLKNRYKRKTVKKRKQTSVDNTGNDLHHEISLKIVRKTKITFLLSKTVFFFFEKKYIFLFLEK